jgi:hypothetical protein
MQQACTANGAQPAPLRRLHHGWRLLILLTLGCCTSMAIGQATTPSAFIAGEWRISQASTAPWWKDAAPPPREAWVGMRVVVGPGRIDAPGALGCSNATFQSGVFPLEGLFQGNLPVPQRNAALSLAIVSDSVSSTQVNCSTGIFDYHHVTPQTMLVALDNVVWTFSRTRGALAAADTPEGTVQRMLEAHFANDMGFLPENVQRKRDWLTPELAGAINAWFALPGSRSDVPSINGDPFTDTQEAPARFSVQASRTSRKRATVPVRFAVGTNDRELAYELLKDNGGWRLDDIAYDEGSLRELLEDATDR